MSKIPSDLTIEILCRLPVKSLRRFRCVSKEFCSLIDNPDFIKLYFNHSIETGTDLSLILAGFHDLNIHPLKPDDKTTYKVVGSCNGLLALYNCEEGFSLLNPSTKTHKILPKFWEDFKGSFCCYDGFGYEDVTDDYKIVRVMQVRSTKHTVVIVYSLKSNSRKVINYVDFPYSFNFPITQDFGVLVDGSLHWKVIRVRGPITDQLIMAFDLVDEEFLEVELPNATVRDRYITMGVLGGCLYISCDYKGHVDAWVMKNDDSWTKLFSVFERQGCEYMKALAYSKKGDQVLIRLLCNKNDNIIYCWYDLEKKRFDEGFLFDYEPKCFYEVICVGSLVNEIRVRRLSGVIDPEVIPHCIVSYRAKKKQKLRGKISRCSICKA